MFEKINITHLNFDNALLLAADNAQINSERYHSGYSVIGKKYGFFLDNLLFHILHAVTKLLKQEVIVKS